MALICALATPLAWSFATCSFPAKTFQVDGSNHIGRFQLNGRPNNNEDDTGSTTNALQSMAQLVQMNPSQSVLFSIAMAVSGAVLGPFLDSYHSAYGVLKYDEPLKATLWGTSEFPALTTAWWVPELFGLAGFLIGWLYILLDEVNQIEPNKRQPTTPKILVGISFFTLQYWLSGILYDSGVERTSILNIMSVLAAGGFLVMDGTFSGFLTSTATAIGGPLIEAGLIRATQLGLFPGGYHYTDAGETGFFPLWICPVYFLGGQAVGNLARGIWNALAIFDTAKQDVESTPKEPAGCEVCNDTRAVSCPNCDGMGQYVAMGNRMVQCTSCKGRGRVICRACFSYYDEDPNDIQAIREKMSRIPD